MYRIRRTSPGISTKEYHIPGYEVRTEWSGKGLEVSILLEVDPISG